MDWEEAPPPSTDSQGAPPPTMNPQGTPPPATATMNTASLLAMEQPVTPAPAPMRSTYPDVATFSGEDLKEYDVFQLNLRTKLETDGHFYSTTSRQVLYGFERLTGKASQ
ncbi:hypothetical protein N7535_006273 [Penicillium sp. DV-2018c]|nr:hypothetical protein N7461_007644 [Penicillium sp. DV-2018c]KAJ5566967.1 hypothetical protein N7535_006273 [Penicillium sp. DV-2018c]